MNEVLKVLKSRRSVRSYKQEQISEESLDLIIKSGIYAPSANNQQPWHFTVIQNKELLDFINEKAKELMIKSESEFLQKAGANADFQITYHAPTLIIVSGKKDAPNWSTDCSIALENMVIAAESLDIGSVWIGMLRFFFQQEDAVKKLGLPEGYVPFYGIALGYKANEVEQSEPKRNMDVVEYIR